MLYSVPQCIFLALIIDLLCGNKRVKGSACAMRMSEWTLAAELLMQNM